MKTKLFNTKALIFSAGFALSFSSFADFGVDSGGGNTVQGMLFDDYENYGSETIHHSEIEQLADTYLLSLSEKVPTFAAKLRSNISNLVWYKESKPLAQDGPCRNSSNLVITDQVVRACQDLLSVRIEKDFYDNSEILADLIIHELLVYEMLHSSDRSIQEGSVLMVSRAVRSKEASFQTSEQLQELLQTTGFGEWINASQTEQIDELKKELKRYEAEVLALVRQARSVEGIDARSELIEDGSILIKTMNKVFWSSHNKNFQDLIMPLMRNVNELMVKLL